MKVPKKSVFAVVVLTATAYFFSNSAESPIQSQMGRQVGIIEANRINEVSGIVASRKNKGVLWVHNDSGDPSILYAIKHNGELLGTYRIRRAPNRKNPALHSRIMCKGFHDVRICRYDKKSNIPIRQIPTTILTQFVLRRSQSMSTLFRTNRSKNLGRF